MPYPTDINKKLSEEYNSEKLTEKAKRLEKEVLKSQEVVEMEDELQEQLTVIKEVRTELAKAYVDIKSVNGLNEQLRNDVSALQNQVKEIEMLKKELETYKLKEVESEKLAYNNRLSKLSDSFKYLGQVKTMEELSKLDKKTVDELEKVTQLAISNKASEKLDSVTMPAQAIQPIQKNDNMKRVESLNKVSFAQGICGILTAQQEKSGKRIISL
jgi:hypothetical protein